MPFSTKLLTVQKTNVIHNIRYNMSSYYSQTGSLVICAVYKLITHRRPQVVPIILKKISRCPNMKKKRKDCPYYNESTL